jgi:hypothetical protein
VILGTAPFPSELLRMAALVRAQLPAGMQSWMTWYAVEPSYENWLRPPEWVYPWQMTTSSRTANDVVKDIKHRVDECLQLQRVVEREAQRQHADQSQMAPQQQRCVVGEWAHDIAHMANEVREQLSQSNFTVRIVDVKPVHSVQSVDNFFVWSLMLNQKAAVKTILKWQTETRTKFLMLLEYAHRFSESLQNQAITKAWPSHSLIPFEISRINDDQACIRLFRELSEADIVEVLPPVDVRLRWVNRAVVWHRPDGVVPQLE